MATRIRSAGSQGGAETVCVGDHVDVRGELPSGSAVSARGVVASTYPGERLLRAQQFSSCAVHTSPKSVHHTVDCNTARCHG